MWPEAIGTGSIGVKISTIKLVVLRISKFDQTLGRRSLCLAGLDKKSSLEIKTVNAQEG
jgi:hypothetical protein